MNDNEIKAKILDLLSNRDATKQEIKDTLWIESMRKLENVLRSMRKENLIYYSAGKYSLIKKEVIAKPRSPKKALPKHLPQITILRILFSVISVGASIVSVRNTSIYLLESYSPVFAFMLSGLMSIFMVTSMGALVLFMQRKKYAIATLLGVLWLVVTAFSMSSTVVGMYNQQKEQFVEKTSIERVDRTAQMQYTQYEKQERDIQRLIDDKATSLKRFNTLISAYDTLEKRDADRKSYNSLAYAISEAEGFIQKKTTELGAITDKKLSLLDSFDDTKVVARSFYEEMELLFGIKASLIQFFLSTLAAVFVDILSPLGASMALFLKDED